MEAIDYIQPQVAACDFTHVFESFLTQCKHRAATIAVAYIIIYYAAGIISRKHHFFGIYSHEYPFSSVCKIHDFIGRAERIDINPPQTTFFHSELYFL